MTLSLSSLGERALVQRITARLARSGHARPPWVLIGPGDDAAVIEPERGSCDVLTTDAIVEGVHFDRSFVPMSAIGHRALAVNLSDVAAMGALPRAALLSLVLPETIETADVDALLDGLLDLAATHRVTLIGGNITRTSGPLVIDVTAIGSVRPRKLLTRAGARPGDDVYVTGSLGAAAVGLRSLLAGAGNQTGSTFLEASRKSRPGLDACRERYLRPEPRVRAGVLLGRNRAASSCMDLSDGLGDAAHQVAEASGVGITIDAETLPLADGVTAWHAAHGGDPVTTAISGGDDYELLFTVRPSHRGRLRTVRRQLGPLAVTKIGTVTRERDVLLRTADGSTTPLPGGYEHFR